MHTPWGRVQNPSQYPPLWWSQHPFQWPNPRMDSGDVACQLSFLSHCVGAGTYLVELATRFPICGSWKSHESQGESFRECCFQQLAYQEKNIWLHTDIVCYARVLCMCLSSFLLNMLPKFHLHGGTKEEGHDDLGPKQVFCILVAAALAAHAPLGRWTSILVVHLPLARFLPVPLGSRQALSTAVEIRYKNRCWQHWASCMLLFKHSYVSTPNSGSPSKFITEMSIRLCIKLKLSLGSHRWW